MRKLIVDDWMSLDGVVQGPSSPDEDRSGGFDHGGWHVPFMDEDAIAWVVHNVSEAGAFVFGRRTYELFAAYWPTARPEEAAVADPLNERTKYVVSRSLAEPLPWRNSHLLTGDAQAAVALLKLEGKGDLHILGSTHLARTLLQEGLVDEVRLMIDPVVVGTGTRLFGDGVAIERMRLVDSSATAHGAILATYDLARG